MDSMTWQEREEQAAADLGMTREQYRKLLITRVWPTGSLAMVRNCASACSSDSVAFAHSSPPAIAKEPGWSDV
jgi:hypothetical protein